MGKGVLALCFLVLAAGRCMAERPSEKQVAGDAADFHRFRTAALARATEISKGKPDSDAGMQYLDGECKKLAGRTHAEYLFGIVDDLIRDKTRTEEPYLIAVMVLDDYPPEQARVVVKEIIADPRYKACGDVKSWLWEIDEAEKGRAK